MTTNMAVTFGANEDKIGLLWPFIQFILDAENVITFHCDKAYEEKDIEGAIEVFFKVLTDTKGQHNLRVHPGGMDMSQDFDA